MGKVNRKSDIQEYFWSRVDRSGDCWLWTASKTARGYGKLRVDGKQAYAHRVAYELTNGAIPDGLVICHHCDNPPCCNPAHLFMGTQGDNMRDRDAKGRLKAALIGRDRQSGRSWTPERRAQVSERQAERMADPQVRQRQREFAQAYWADPEARRRKSEERKAFFASKKTETRS